MENQETKNKQPDKNNDEGNKLKEPEPVKLAREERERMAEENTRREKILEREEALAAHRQLSGTAEAGKAALDKKEETNSEYTSRIMKGGSDE